MLNFYYDRIKHLRIAQPIIKDINLLENTINNYTKNKAIQNITYITLKYRLELDKIAIFMSARPVVIGEETKLYQDYQKENLIEDIEYLIECLVIIGATKYGVVKSIEEALENLNQQ